MARRGRSPVCQSRLCGRPVGKGVGSPARVDLGPAGHAEASSEESTGRRLGGGHHRVWHGVGPPWTKISAAVALWALRSNRLHLPDIASPLCNVPLAVAAGRFALAATTGVVRHRMLAVPSPQRYETVTDARRASSQARTASHAASTSVTTTPRPRSWARTLLPRSISARGVPTAPRVC
jgi:hypothetical protein